VPAPLVVITTFIIPGIGHLLLRRYLKGTILAAIFCVSTDVFLLSTCLWHASFTSALPLVSLGIMVLAWVYALADIVPALKALQQKGLQEEKDSLLKRAQVAWLKDELAEAERLLRDILRMDERDIEAWVHLGKVLKCSGNPVEARRCFQSALNLEGSDPWRWTLQTELGTAGIRAPSKGGETESS
jgi:cytochrome c-type biogenesis protein CcmH/NrfG